MAWTQVLPSGRWRGLYRANGKTMSVGTFDKEDKARKAAETAEDDARVSHGEQTWAQYWSMWSEKYLPRNRSTGTITAYEKAQRLRVAPHWDGVKLRDITPGKLELWVEDLRADGWSEKTTKVALTVMSTALRDAVRQSLIPVNPAREVRVPVDEVRPSEPLWLSKVDAAKLADAMEREDDRELLRFLFATGLRIGEAAAVTWADIDLDRAEVRVARTWTQTEFGPPKSRRSRVVPLTDAVVVMLRARLARKGVGTPPVAPVRSIPPLTAGLVFTERSGAIVRSPALSQRMSVAAAKVGVDTSVSAHTCRHSAASWAVQAGVPLAAVKDLLGHQSITTTEIYSHLARTSDDAIRAALG